jgi:hypothetical protein
VAAGSVIRFSWTSWTCRPITLVALSLQFIIVICQLNVEQSRLFMKVTEGAGACIVLGNNTTRETMHPEGFEERMKLIRDVLKTEDKPRWYVLAGPVY